VKRLSGIIASAIVLILVSLFQVLMSAGMGFAGVILPSHPSAQSYPGVSGPPPSPAWMSTYMYALGVFFLALAAWGIVTAIGLFRVRRWARYSILIIGGGMALIGFVSVLVMIPLMFVPLPVPPSADPSQAAITHTVTSVVFAAMAFFYAIPLAIGAWWLVYFNRKRVRDYFNAAATGPILPSRRPLLISILAVLCAIGVPSCLLMVFLPLPALFFGILFQGWQKAVVYIAFAALEAAVAYGLWKLLEWGRRLAIFLQVLGIVNTAIYLVNPSLLFRYSGEVNRSMGLPEVTLLPGQFQSVMLTIPMSLSLILLVAVIVILHRYRAAFQPAGTPPATTDETPQLPSAS
jgi:hypothetical protein